jgi:hypothetical protein
MIYDFLMGFFYTHTHTLLNSEPASLNAGPLVCVVCVYVCIEPTGEGEPILTILGL